MASVVYDGPADSHEQTVDADTISDSGKVEGIRGNLKDDGYLLGGHRRTDADSGTRPWVAHVSTVGHQRWARTIETPSSRGKVNAVSVTADAMGALLSAGAVTVARRSITDK